MEKPIEKHIRKVFPVPVVLLVDIAKIVVKNQLSNSLTAVNVFEAVVWLTVHIPASHPHGKQIIENIEVMLSNYNMFTHSSPNTLTNQENNFSI
jgi:hypothetical protein